MNFEKFEKMVDVVLTALRSENLQRDLLIRKDYYGNVTYDPTRKLKYLPQLEARLKNLMSLAIKILPDHKDLFLVTTDKINDEVGTLNITDAISLLEHLKEIIDIEKESEAKIEDMKIFEGAEEKMKKVNLSFRKNDYNSCFNNLNTALELILKEKLGIPLTITKVNTAKIVDILVKHKIEPYLYLLEAKKHITDITNKLKHSAYVPSKSECIFAIKAMEELLAKLKTTEIELSEEVRSKIHEGL